MSSGFDDHSPLAIHKTGTMQDNAMQCGPTLSAFDRDVTRAPPLFLPIPVLPLLDTSWEESSAYTLDITPTKYLTIIFCVCFPQSVIRFLSGQNLAIILPVDWRPFHLLSSDHIGAKKG